jgi:hypothetical protein
MLLRELISIMLASGFYHTILKSSPMNDKINTLLNNHAKDICIRYNNWWVKQYFDKNIEVVMGDDDVMFQQFLDDEKANAKPEKDNKPYFISKNSSK